MRMCVSHDTTTLCNILLGLMVAVVGRPAEVRAAYYPIRYMDIRSGCQPTLDLSSDHAGKLQLTTRAHYRHPWACTTALEAGSGQHIALRVLSLDIHHKDRLDIYDGGSDDDGDFLDSLRGIYSSHNAFTSSGQQMALKFVSDRAEGSEHTGFKLLYTIYREGAACDYNFYNCSNLRCIDKSLVCDSYDNCGDFSDEEDCEVVEEKEGRFDGGGTLAAIILGCLLLVVVSVVCLTYIKRRAACYSLGDPAQAQDKHAHSAYGVTEGASSYGSRMDFDNPLAKTSDQ